MNVTINLSPEAEEKVRQRAAESGQSVDCYLRSLIERQVLGTTGRFGDPAPASASPPANAQPWPPFPKSPPIPPEILEWARKTLNEEEIIAGMREIEETGGLQLEDFIKDLEKAALGHE